MLIGKKRITVMAAPEPEQTVKLVKLINSTIQPNKPLTDQDVFIRSMHLTSDRINTFGGRFDIDELQKMKELAADCPVLVGHNHHANGLIKFNLNTGFHFVRLFKPGYIFTVPETLVVWGATSKNYSGTLLDPGVPSSPSLCRVYGWVFGLSADSLSGVTVTAEIRTSPLKAGLLVISPYLKGATTNSSDFWQLDLYPNASLTPATAKYEFTIYLNSAPIARRTVIVPFQTSWQFTW